MLVAHGLARTGQRDHDADREWRKLPLRERFDWLLPGELLRETTAHGRDDSAKALEAQGKMPPPPEIFGASSMAELLDTGKIKIAVDGKYPQAIGISNVLAITSTFGNAAWDIIINTHASENPFFTSDYPAALEYSSDARVMSRIVPLAPDIAVRITPNLPREQKLDLSFARMRFRTVRPKSAEIRELNKLIIQGAEELVFFRDDLYWIPGFVACNRDFRVEAIDDTIPAGTEYYVVATQRIRRRSEAFEPPAKR